MVETGAAAPPPAVSVIVPAYGVAHLLGEALASLQAQRRQDWEAIVVDDGAPDDVAGAFAPFAKDPRFRLLLTDNGGLSVARNRAIAQARAPFIALLDGDDLYEPDYLARMLARIQADEGLGFVYCDAFVFGEHLRRVRRYSETWPLIGQATLDRVLSREAAIFGACLIRRSALEAVGGFDETLRSAEDLDLWVRLLAAGWGAALTQAPLVRYRRRRGSLSTNSERIQLESCKLYRKAAQRLEGRPEQATAQRMLAVCEQRLSWARGEQRLRAGDVAGALRLMTGVEQPSARWRVAFALLRRAPWLSGLLLALRERLPAPMRAPRRSA